MRRLVWVLGAAMGSSHHKRFRSRSPTPDHHSPIADLPRARPSSPRPTLLEDAAAELETRRARASVWGRAAGRALARGQGPARPQAGKAARIWAARDSVARPTYCEVVSARTWPSWAWTVRSGTPWLTQRVAAVCRRV